MGDYTVRGRENGKGKVVRKWERKSRKRKGKVENGKENSQKMGGVSGKEYGKRVVRKKTSRNIISKTRR